MTEVRCSWRAPVWVPLGRSGSESAVSGLRQYFSCGLRSLRGRPGSASMTAAMVAPGIAATPALFSVFDAILLMDAVFLMKEIP
jgi:hypothetical protein